jgi:hypothetical protein
MPHPSALSTTTLLGTVRIRKGGLGMPELDPDRRFDLILFGCSALLIGLVVFMIFR